MNASATIHRQVNQRRVWAKLAHSASSACAVVLAGGLGTRIRHLYPDLPKPMAPVAGAPFVEWVVRYLQGQGVTQFVVSLGHLAEVAEEYFATRSEQGCRIRTVLEPTPLGTGGALAFAAQAADPSTEIFVMVNGDSLVLADLSSAWQLLADDTIDGVVIALDVADASRYGRLDVAGDGRLLKFAEKQPGAGLINAGVYLLRRRLVERFSRQRPLSIERDVFPALLAGGARLQVERCQAPFLDIGTPETIAQADEFIRRHFFSQVKA
ncbi:MAG TPA: nucleotidyltransferase family protein [Pirellulales bacterium]|nr:nucleotidyltransferase family protein [Pirellulales bacterium]